MQGCNVRPMGDRVLVERIDETDGKERVSDGGIILPPKDMTLKRGRSAQIPDTFRARVLAVGPDARHELTEGAEVIVHTYDQRPDQTLAGEQTRFGLLVRLADVLAEVEPMTYREMLKSYSRLVDEGIVQAAAKLNPALFVRDAMAAEERYARADYENTPPFEGMRPKTQDFAPTPVEYVDREELLRKHPKPPESVEDLGFHRADDVTRDRIKTALDVGFRRPIPIPPEAIVHVPDDVAAFCGLPVEHGYTCTKDEGHEAPCAWDAERDPDAREVRTPVVTETWRMKL